MYIKETNVPFRFGMETIVNIWSSHSFSYLNTSPPIPQHLVHNPRAASFLFYYTLFLLEVVGLATFYYNITITLLNSFFIHNNIIRYLPCVCLRALVLAYITLCNLLTRWDIFVIAPIVIHFLILIFYFILHIYIKKILFLYYIITSFGTRLRAWC